ncbi:MAG: hypothetical protein ACRDQ1_13945, partial [Sciscionella sp.]
MPAHDPLYAGAYHRLTRPRSGSWWRLVVALALGAIGFLVASVVGVLLVDLVALALGRHAVTLSSGGIGAGLLLATNIGLALLVPVAILLTWAVYSIRPRWLCSLRPGFRWGWWGRSLVIAGALWLVLFALVLAQTLTSGPRAPSHRVVALVAVVVLT